MTSGSGYMAQPLNYSLRSGLVPSIMCGGTCPAPEERSDDWYRATKLFTSLKFRAQQTPGIRDRTSSFLISIMNKRLHIYYSGSVQGVGFRFVAQGTAGQLNVTGWVKNLEDGRVEVVCEGGGTALNKFLDKIKDVFGAYIRDTMMEQEKATGEFERFDIKFF